MTILIVDRKTEKVEEEKVYGESVLQLVYKETFFSKCLRALISKLPIASSLFGLWQKSFLSKRQINPFVQKFHVNLNESEKTEFKNFNDFFVRKLKRKARPISEDGAVAPADGRYLAYDRISLFQEIYVKGKKLSIQELLGGDVALSRRYIGGSLLMARLAPPDYHRFHFPVDGIAKQKRKIGGYLFSVNPMALKNNISYLSQNKRVLVEIQSEKYGLVTFVAVGATNVGSIHFTYKSQKPHAKGDELGYFSFGASMVIVLFEPGKVTFAEDITKNTKDGLETLCRVGESLINPI
jgi:phosphatidylserine decarboxylase